MLGSKRASCDCSREVCGDIWEHIHTHKGNGTAGGKSLYQKQDLDICSIQRPFEAGCLELWGEQNKRTSRLIPWVFSIKRSGQERANELASNRGALWVGWGK